MVFQLKNANQIDDDSTNLIVQHAHKSKHDEIQIGICCIYLFNSESETAPAWFNCLMMASRDNLQHIVNKIQDMLIHKYLKISKVVKNGILRLLNEMARASLPSHAIINILLRQIIGGEHGPDNIHLVESLLDICIEHRAWLEKNQECLQSVFFRYLRLIQVRFQTQNFSRNSPEKIAIPNPMHHLGSLEYGSKSCATDTYSKRNSILCDHFSFKFWIGASNRTRCDSSSSLIGSYS